MSWAAELLGQFISLIFYLNKEMLIAGIVTLGKDYRQRTFFCFSSLSPRLRKRFPTSKILKPFQRRTTHRCTFSCFKVPSTTMMHKKMFSHNEKYFLSDRLTLDESNIPELQSCTCSWGRNLLWSMPSLTADVPPPPPQPLPKEKLHRPHWRA